MSTEPISVLFLCTENSARSIMAEAILRGLGGDRFHAYSAGSHPSGHVHPAALAVLNAHGMPGSGLRSKNWNELAKPGAPVMHVVVTVCDHAAGESCPMWPGRPVRGHWSIADPAHAAGLDETQAFEQCFARLRARIEGLCRLSIVTLEPAALAEAIRRLDA